MLREAVSGTADHSLDAVIIPRRRDSRRFLPFILAAQDVVLIYVAFALAYWTRYDLALGPRIHNVVDFAGYQPLGLVLLASLLLALLLRGGYRTRLNHDFLHEAGTVLGATTMAMAVVIVVTFMLHRYDYSRAVVIYIWLLAALLLIAGRVVNRVVKGVFYRRGWGTRRVLIIGATDAGKMIMQSIAGRPDLGFAVTGFVYHGQYPGPDFGRFQALGTVDDVPWLLEAHRIDDVVVALPTSARADIDGVVDICERAGKDIKLVPDLHQLSLSRVEMDDIAGIPVLDVRAQPLQRVGLAAKRAMDITGGVMLLVAGLPVIGILAVLIRLDSRGPVFIRQERVGLRGERFTCFKLRTMQPDADSLLATLRAHNEATGPVFKMRQDPRCTRVGRYIRRLSLDELPQLCNVLRGDMSLVGPRPPLAHEVAEYETWHHRRLEVKPGLTGIWQVSGRSDLPFDEMVMMDIMYIDNWSLGLDLKLLARTLAAVFLARGAY